MNFLPVEKVTLEFLFKVDTSLEKRQISVGTGIKGNMKRKNEKKKQNQNQPNPENEVEGLAKTKCIRLFSADGIWNRALQEI